LNAAVLPLAKRSLLLPEKIRHAIREEVRREPADMSGPIEIEMEIRFASGQR
jgi:hypothetical protein